MITISGTRDVDVNVEESDIIEQAIKIVENLCRINDCFLSEDRKEIRQNDEYQHGSMSDSLVRKTRSNDLKAFTCIEVLNRIRKQLRD